MALPCLTFLSKNGDFTLEIANHYRNWDGILEYSIDRENWIEWDANDILNSSNGLLYLRGTGNSVITGGVPDEYGSWIIAPDDSQNVVSVEGNIESLLDWEKVSDNIHPNMEVGCFHDMFHNCTCLTTAPELPAKEITTDCYAHMFDGCINLTIAPKLPATVLYPSCYAGMFSGCVNLTTPPVLKATVLGASCCSDMFYGCTNLVSAPELPATTLAEACYMRMFGGCTSLIIAPELPATTLARSCYSDMFFNCTSLTKASDLPAMILAENCYSDMFMNCINLVSPPTIFATTLNDNCCAGMFSGCTSLAVAPELPATILADNCYNGMFSGCTSFITVPELPAITLAEYCYSNMFRNCINLTTIPMLPATILATGCYYNMFYGCSNLKISATRNEIYKYPYRIPSSGQGTDAPIALSDMFGATGGTFTGSPAINTKYYTDHTEKAESIISITGGVIPGFDPVSYIVGKSAGGSGGGGDVPLLTRAEWDALTTAQKQAYGFVAIKVANSGFYRGDLVYGADYMSSLLTSSSQSNILAEARCEEYDIQSTNWDRLTLIKPTIKSNDRSVILDIDNCAYYDFGIANVQCTVYAVIKQARTVDYNATAVGLAYSVSSGNCPNFFAPSNTMNLYTSLYGDDVSTGYSLGNYLMLVIRIGENKNVRFFVNNVYTENKTARNSGSIVSFSAANNNLVNSIPVEAKYLAVVYGAETDIIVSANMQNIMAYYKIV